MSDIFKQHISNTAARCRANATEEGVSDAVDRKVKLTKKCRSPMTILKLSSKVNQDSIIVLIG